MALLDERRCHVEVNGASLSAARLSRPGADRASDLRLRRRWPAGDGSGVADADGGGELQQAERDALLGRPHRDGAVGGHDRACHRPPSGAVRGAQHLPLGRLGPPRAQLPAQRASPDRPRARGRTADRPR